MTASIAPQVETPTIWQIDPAHTLIEFAVKHMMFATVKGRFGGVHGTIVDDAADPSRSSVEVAPRSVGITLRVVSRAGGRAAAEAARRIARSGGSDGCRLPARGCARTTRSHGSPRTSA